MTQLEIRYATVIDALDRKRSGWIVFENDKPGVPFADKNQAIRHAKAIAVIRGKSEDIVKIEARVI